MLARIGSVRRFLVVGLLFAPVFLFLPIAVLGDEEEPEACSEATLPSQMTPTTYPVDSTELVITEGQLSFTGTNSSTASHRNATISMDTVTDDYGTGRILVAWEGNTIGSNCTGSAIYAIHLNSDGTSVCAPVFLSPPVGTYTGFHTNAYQPSAALTGDGEALVAWTGHAYGAPPATFPEARAIAFALNDLCSLSPPSAPLQPNGGYRDQEISVGIGSVSSVASWSRASDPPGDALPGLLYTVTTEQQIRACNPCWQNQWQPCAAMRSDSKYIICWSDFEFDDGGGNVYFDVRLQAYDADGSAVGSEVTVNIPISVNYTTEDSPAVAIDAPDQNGISNVIVVWTSLQPDGCANRRHIYARRLTWDGSTTPAFVSEQFIVDNDTSFKPISATLANPTVALTTDPDHRGRLVAAWNVYANSGDPPTDIDAQFFEADGKPMGREFRVNYAHETSGTQYSRFLANSAQHTASYGSTSAFAFTRGNLAGGAFTSLDVHFTLLPAGYADYQESLAPGCLRGDVNFDGYVNLDDVPIFVAVLLDGPPGGACSNIIDLCPYDLNVDGAVNGLDVQCFTLTILGREEECSFFAVRILDCNGNSVSDGEDIENETSNDANGNGLPDECEPDCNTNGVPDDWDIAQATSADCNTNGTPDECEADCNTNGVPDDCDVNPADPDGNSQVSSDCNGNGLPDECESDCNTNGVPDSCDIDPGDPDGNEQVSPDCNTNGVPDECEFHFAPPLGSSDCNTNGIPDECDIASCESDPVCGDCNSNGIPDGCDIAAEVSEDADTNGIPDECEGEGMMGGGGSSMMSGEGGEGEGESSWDGESAWAAYYEWAAAQCWGPNCDDPTDAQFAAMVAKLQELGLPVQGHPGG